MIFGKSRIEEIEKRVGALERKNRCRSGSHEWEVQYPYGESYSVFFPPFDYSKPYIGCKHCFTEFKPEKAQKAKK